MLCRVQSKAAYRVIAFLRYAATMPRLWVLLLTLLSIAAGVHGQAAREVQDDGVASARYLLSRAQRGEGREADAVLTGLRHLRRPALRPVFERWARSDRAPLRLHGLLGLAELAALNEHGGLDLAATAELPEAWMQAQAVTAALDENLLDDDRLARLLTWEGLDDRVQLILAAELMRRGGEPPREPLRHALGSRNLGRRALAALLLHQLGEPEAEGGAQGGAQGVLAELADAHTPGREVVVAMLLEAALRHDLTRSGPWALSLAADEAMDERVRLLAMRVAMRFGQRGAYELWQRRYDAAEGGDGGERRRLAMLALHLSPWVEGAVFEQLAGEEDASLARIGRAGAAIAARQPDMAERAAALVASGEADVSAWAVAWAGEPERASGEDAALVLLAVLREGAKRASDPAWLERSAQAAQALHERGKAGGDEGTSGALRLRPMLGDPDVSPSFKQAVLLGLLRSREAGASAAVASHEQTVTGTSMALNEPRAEMLAALLKARDDQRLTRAELRDLRELGRGAGDPGPALRMQAAWLYLEAVGQAP